VPKHQSYIIKEAESANGSHQVVIQVLK